MPTYNRPIRTQSMRSSHEIHNSLGAGPYIAKVVSHLDKTFNGKLKVQILRGSVSGDDDSKEAQVKIVRYASPFYGVTPLYAAGDADSYGYTQQSYGFWAVPPDPGTLVLCTFVEGMEDYGFWFACVPDDFMNFMIPDGRPSTSNTSPQSTPQAFRGKKLPVGEYNKNKINPQGQNQPTYYSRPVNSDFTNHLLEQGLLDDDIRGTTSTSARREAPSMVFGLSSPGPLDKRPGAPKIPKGTYEGQELIHSSRLGGHSIVMDDGDEKILRKGPADSTPAEYVNLKQNETGGDPTLPANELFRIRTRTGHQILLHNTEDLIYIANSKGTAWLEMTSNGKIDIYAADSVSIHSQYDLNFTADRDINFTAFENMNIIVGNEFKKDVGNSISVTSGDNYMLNTADGISLNAGTFLTGNAEDSVTLIAQSEMALLAAADLSIGSSAQIGIEACSNIKISTDGDYHNKALGTMYTTADGNYHTKVTGNVFTQAEGEINSLSALATKITSGQVMGIKSTGANVLVTGSSDIHLNGPTAPSASSATPAVLPPIPDPIIPMDPKRAAVVARVPQHEPWFQHENFNPQAYVPAATRAGNEQVDSFPAPRSSGGAGVVPDTYIPPSTPQQAGTINAAYSPSFDATRGTASDLQNGATTYPDITQDPTVNAYRGTPGGPIPESKVPGVITGFTKAETAAFLGAIGKRESNNAYDAVNSIGYSGKYQFGVAALEDRGYVKSGTWRTYKKNRVLADSSVWTGKDGITSREAWLSSPEVQEKVMVEHVNANLKTLQRIGAVKQGDSKSTIMGMLAGSHLLGPGGMKSWRNGAGGADAYGTTGGEYYGLGVAAYTGTSGGTAVA